MLLGIILQFLLIVFLLGWESVLALPLFSSYFLFQYLTKRSFEEQILALSVFALLLLHFYQVSLFFTALIIFLCFSPFLFWSKLGSLRELVLFLATLIFQLLFFCVAKISLNIFLILQVSIFLFWQSKKLVHRYAQ